MELMWKKLLVLWLFTFIKGIVCENEGVNLQGLEISNGSPEVADVVPKLLFSLHEDASEIGDFLGEPLTYGLDEESWQEFTHKPSTKAENVMLQNYLQKMYTIFGKAASVLGNDRYKREAQKLNDTQVLFSWFFERFGDPSVQKFTEIMDSEQLDQATPPPPQDNADVVFVGERSYDISHRLANPSPSDPEDYRGRKVEYEIGNVGSHLYQRKMKFSRKMETSNQNEFDKIKSIDSDSLPEFKKTFEKVTVFETKPDRKGNLVMKKVFEKSSEHEETSEKPKGKDVQFKELDKMILNHAKLLSEIHQKIGNSDNMSLRKMEREIEKPVESSTFVPVKSLETVESIAGDEGRQFIEPPSRFQSDLSFGERRHLEAKFKSVLGKIRFTEETLCNFANCSKILGKFDGKPLTMENMIADEASQFPTSTVESSSESTFSEKSLTMIDIAVEEPGSSMDVFGNLEENINLEKGLTVDENSSNSSGVMESIEERVPEDIQFVDVMEEMPRQDAVKSHISTLKHSHSNESKEEFDVDDQQNSLVLMERLKEHVPEEIQFVEEVPIEDAITSHTSMLEHLHGNLTGEDELAVNDELHAFAMESLEERVPQEIQFMEEMPEDAVKSDVSMLEFSRENNIDDFLSPMEDSAMNAAPLLSTGQIKPSVQIPGEKIMEDVMVIEDIPEEDAVGEAPVLSEMLESLQKNVIDEESLETKDAEGGKVPTFSTDSIESSSRSNLDDGRNREESAANGTSKNEGAIKVPIHSLVTEDGEKTLISRSPDRSRRETPSVKRDASDSTSPNYGPELEGEDFVNSVDKMAFLGYATILSLLVIGVLFSYWMLACRRRRITRKYDPNALNVPASP